MHIPDGFLTPSVVIVTNVSATALFVLSAKKVEKYITTERIPIMGLLSAFVFASQLFTIPVIGGTSVHIIGGLLTAIILGPYSAFLVISTVLLLQAFLFGHGGILTVGANIINMGLFSTFLGYFIYVRLGKKNIAIIIACVITTILGAVSTSVLLTISGIVSLRISVLMMTATHLIAGIIEGVVTIAVLKGINRVKPEIISLTKI